jgi:hypothetical protein
MKEIGEMNGERILGWVMILLQGTLRISGFRVSFSSRKLMIWANDKGASTLDNNMQGLNSTEVRSQDIGIFDPMSFFGIFDNLGHEIGAFGGMTNL